LLGTERTELDRVGEGAREDGREDDPREGVICPSEKCGMMGKGSWSMAERWGK
jgi:hypothetical protein